MREPKFTESAHGVPPLLICPRCRCCNLHQHTVEVFARGEDEPSKRVTVDQYSGDVTTVSNVPGSENPSFRRQGLQIHFVCEHGCPVQTLIISQHKGSTEMFWK